MLGAKERAAGTAPQVQHQSQLYNHSKYLSREKLKENCAVLLLYLQTPLSREQQKRYWQLFKSRLKQYLESVPELPEGTNSELLD